MGLVMNNNGFVVDGNFHLSCIRSFPHLSDTICQND